MLVERANPAVEVCMPAAAVSMEALLAALAQLVEHIVEALAMFAQSNYVSGYPNEEVRCVDYHYYCRAAGSNSYYSFFFLYILNSS